MLNHSANTSSGKGSPLQCVSGPSFEPQLRAYRMGPLSVAQHSYVISMSHSQHAQQDRNFLPPTPVLGQLSLYAREDVSSSLTIRRLSSNSASLCPLS